MDLKARRTFPLTAKQTLRKGDPFTVSDELGQRLITRGDAERAPVKVATAKVKPPGKSKPAPGKTKSPSSSAPVPAPAPSTSAEPEAAPAL